MLGVKAASLGKMGTHTLDGASHTDVTSLTEAKGDILVYTGSTWDKLAIGTNNKILIADSSTSTGLAWAEDITIGGDLTVSGDTITANVATIQVEDKNMELNKVGSPSDSNADGGGLTIKGTSDKTITFTNATGDFDFSENVDIASGKTFKVNGTTVLSNNTLGSGVTSSSLTSLGTITTGVWNGTAIGLAYGGTGLVGATDGKIVVADGSGAPVAVQAMTANDGTFKHEVGGIEADISAIAKGGIVAGSGTGSMAIRTVGSNDHVLTADSSEATGMKWAAAASGAVTALNNATANEIVTVGSTTTELDAEANLTFDGSGDLEIGAGSSGDPRITFDINSTDEWTVGVDDDDSDKFKIDTGAAVGGATKFSLDSSGNAVIAGALTLGSTSFANSDGVLQVAGQTNITSLGTLTALTVDDIGLDSKTVTMTGSSGDTATLVVAANGAFSINTTDASAAAAHLTVDIDGDITLDAHTGIFKFFDAGSEVLRLTESGSGDVTVKLATDSKDLIFTDNGDAEGFRILDAAAGVKVAGTLDLGHASDTTIARASSGQITVEGTAVLLAGAQTGITSIHATDLIIGEDAETAIDFGTANEIDFKVDNANRLTLDTGALYPATNNQIDLGTSSLEFKDAFFDGTVTADAFAGPLTGNVTGNASGTAATVTGAAQSNITSLGTLTTLTVDNVITNGTTIGHTDDTDLLTLADGLLTVAGEVSMTTLDIGGTNVTSTAAELNILDDATVTTAELNLLDGGTSVGSSITVGDSDGFIVNDGGTMKTIPATDVKTYAGGSGSIYTLHKEFALSGSTNTLCNADFQEDCDYFITITLSQASQSGNPYPYILFNRDTSGTDTWNGTSRFVSQTHGEDEDTFKGSPGNKITLTGSDTQYSAVHQTSSGVPGYFGQFFFHTPRNHSGTNQQTDFKCFQGTAGWYDMNGKLRNVQIWCGFGSNGSDGIKSFTIEAAAEYPDTDGGKGSSVHGSNSIGSNGWEGMIRVYEIDHSA